MEPGPPGYPTNPAFAAALKQARERAAGFTRSRQQASAPDPPDSNDGKKPKDSSGKDRAPGAGSSSAAQPTVAASSSSGAATSRGLDAAAAQAAAERMSQERTAAAIAERTASSSMYHHLPLHGRLGMGLGAGTTGNLLHQLQLSDMHQRLAFEQRQREREALLAAATRGGAWATHPAAAAAAAAAEERWRVTSGLPPLGANPLMSARAALHTGVHPLGPRVSLSGAHLPPLTGAGAEALPPELRAAEYAERAAALGGITAEEPSESAAAAAAAADAEAEAAASATAAPVPPASAVAVGASAIDLLAAAAEDTLRSECREKVGSDSEEDPDAKPPSDPTSSNGEGGGKGKEKEKEKSGKRKRKGANEPKNPLGAFVFYQRKIMADVFEENPCITFGEAAAECGRRWRLLPAEAKEEFRQMAADDKARYTRELASFKNKSESESEVVPPKPVVVPKAKATVRRKKQEGDETKGRSEPKRPKSALLYFKSEEIPKVMKEYPNVTQKEAATEAAARYKALTKPDKEKYEKLAAKDKERYQRELKEKMDVCTVANPGQRVRNVRAKVPRAGEDDEEMYYNPEDAKTEKDINGWSPAAVKIPAQVAYEAMKDPHPYYVEEHAWRYHNPPIPPTKAAAEGEHLKVQQFPYVSHEELRPLPPPLPVPTVFPNTPFCRWSFDQETNVLYADFRRASGDVVVTLEDEKFLLEMYERDDITVVSEGLVSGLDKEKWTLDYISRVAGDEYYHRFRRFDKQTAAEVAAKTKRKQTKKARANASGEIDTTSDKAVGLKEVDKMLSMKVKDFITYLRRRGTALATLHHTTPSEEEKAALCTYSFLDHLGVEHTIDVIESALYMLDYDIVKLQPTLYEDFYSCFKLKDCLPGGSHCMMNCVTSNGRPFMGPNMYIAPPGAFTHFHQDGHGTVDSGHFCLSGFNEVVMTRRLTERAKRHALRILTGGYRHSKGPNFEGLYDLPHADNLGDKPQWPDNDAINKCNQMNYCVSRFILREGQCVHINKGRLHAFRKVTNEQLPPNDCHAKLRAALMIPGTNEPVVGPGKPEILCISVAWDWMYRGVTARGINREIVSILECAALNRKYGAMSLAIPELSLIQMARTLAPKPDERTAAPGAYRESLVGFEDYATHAHNYAIPSKGFMPSASVICKGIFPALQYVVKQHIYAINVAESLKSKSFERGKRVSVAERPNAWENPVTHPLDPYGNSDFFCKLCNKELSNVYLHCDGCELLLSKDFNICLECHQEKRYACSVQMHPLNNKRHSTINHIGNFTFDRASRCPCKNGPVCRHCNYCAGCSCRCHTWFTLYFRFFKKDDELKLLHRVKRLVGREELDAAEEAEKRLSMVIKGRYSEEGEGGPFGLHNMDVMVESQFADAEDVEELEEEPEADEANPAESDSESLGRETPLEPKRKSRRILPDPAESNARESYDGDDVMADAEEEDPPNTSHIDRTNKMDMQVGVSDMKVTIRYRSCEWTEEERDILIQALEEGMDWESIAAKLADRGIDQIRKFAATTYPALVEALEKRSTPENKMEVESEEQVKRSDSTEQSKETKKDVPEAETKETPEADKKEGPETENKEKETNAEDRGAPSSNVATVKVEEPEEPKEPDSTAKQSQPPAADIPTKQEQEETKEAPKEEKFEEKKSESNEAAAAAPASVPAPPPASLKKAKKEGGKGFDKLPPANQGRWSDEEKERLRVALINEKDMDSVERFVATRRMAAIRSFAPRTFPELYQGLRDRMHKPDGKKERPKDRRKSVKIEKVEAKKPDPDEVIGGEESKGPATRRRSRRGSRKPEESEVTAAKIKQEEADEDKLDKEEEEEDSSHDKKKVKEEDPKWDGGDTTEDEEDDEGSSHSDAKSPSKLSLLQRARKQNMRQVASGGGRSRRSTQDLSGGRKRRNSGLTSSRSADPGDDSDTAEEDSAPRVVVTRNKRAKTEEGQD